MLTYYSTTRHFSHSVDELIEMMKWYINHLQRNVMAKPRCANSNMVLFCQNYLDNNGKRPGIWWRIISIGL